MAKYYSEENLNKMIAVRAQERATVNLNPRKARRPMTVRTTDKELEKNYFISPDGRLVRKDEANDWDYD